jgi:hypothetical protein
VGAASNITTRINVAAGTTVAAPSGITVASNAVGTATLGWTDAANNNGGYTLQQRQTGRVASITLASGGSGYTVAPTVTITPPLTAGGVTAVAHAVIGTGGTVSIVIDNAGVGYTARPVVAVTGGTRVGGTAASLLGTANGTLGANVWTTAYVNAVTTPAVTAGNVNGTTVNGLSSAGSYQFQLRADGVAGGVGASAFVASSMVLVK